MKLNGFVVLAALKDTDRNLIFYGLNVKIQPKWTPGAATPNTVQYCSLAAWP